VAVVSIGSALVDIGARHAVSTVASVARAGETPDRFSAQGLVVTVVVALRAFGHAQALNTIAGVARVTAAQK
jgi:hypothetical protein